MDNQWYFLTNNTHEACNSVHEYMKIGNIQDLIESLNGDLSQKVPYTTSIKVQVASVCSGLGIAEMVFDNLNPALQELLRKAPVPTMQARLH